MYLPPISPVLIVRSDKYEVHCENRVTWVIVYDQNILKVMRILAVRHVRIVSKADDLIKLGYVYPILYLNREVGYLCPVTKTPTAHPSC